MMTIGRTAQPARGSPQPAVRAADKPIAAEVMAEAGRRIREARLSRALSIKELALAVGINPSFLSYIETGRKAPSMATLVNLSKELEIELPRLFSAGGRRQSSGERCLGAFMRIASESGRTEKVLYHEILSAYAKLARNKTMEQKAGILKGAVALLHGLRKARAN